MKNKKLIIYTSVITIFTAVFLFSPFQNYQIIQILRITFWTIFILFLPGYLLTLTFFDEKEIDFLERFALSFALSISIVPLLSFYLNLVLIRINALSIFLISLLVIISCIVYLTFFKSKKLWA